MRRQLSTSKWLWLLAGRRHHEVECIRGGDGSALIVVSVPAARLEVTAVAYAVSRAAAAGR
jgi:hypothetical protein